MVCFAGNVVQGKITNTQRIDAALPTIRYALDAGAKVRPGCVVTMHPVTVWTVQ